MKRSASVLIALLVMAVMMVTASPVGGQATNDVLVVEDNDTSTSRRNQLANKFVPTAGTTIAGTGQFTLQSIGPTGLAALTCSQIQAFDVVYIPIQFQSLSATAIKNNPAFKQCFASGERAVVTGYHAEDHGQPATGQFLFDALTWIDGGSQVGLLVLNDIRPSPQKYDFLQPMFPGVYASVRNEVVPYEDITFLTTPPHPIHANTSDGVQNLGKPTMDNWGQTCHTIWNTLGPGGGGYEDDGFIAVSNGRIGAIGPHVCAVAKEGARRADKEVFDLILDDGSGFPDREGAPVQLVDRDKDKRTTRWSMVVEVSTNPIISVVSLERNNGPDPTDSGVTFLASIDDGHPSPPPHVAGAYIRRDDGDLLTCFSRFDPRNPLEQELRPCPTDEKIPGDGDATTAESDLHFQKFQEPRTEQRILRFFKLHCLVPGHHTITFYNKVEPKPPTVDPNLSNNWWKAVLELDCFLRVRIDVKPGSFPNSINTKSRDVVPVAILTDSSFDATTVDPATVCFGDNPPPLGNPTPGMQPPGVDADCTEAHATGHIEDADGDSDMDMVLHYEQNQTGLDPGDTQACLTGRTTTGAPFQGCDSVQVK